MHISSDHICVLITLSIPAPGSCGSPSLSQLNSIFLSCLPAYVSVIRFAYRRMGEGSCTGAQATNNYTAEGTVSLPSTIKKGYGFIAPSSKTLFAQP